MQVFGPVRQRERVSSPQRRLGHLSASSQLRLGRQDYRRASQVVFTPSAATVQTLTLTTGRPIHILLSVSGPLTRLIRREDEEQETRRTWSRDALQNAFQELSFLVSAKHR